MKQITLNVTDESLLPILYGLIDRMEGVSLKPARRRKSGIELALEDKAAGRVYSWNSAEEMFNTLMAK